jgi:hypothetical protein
LPLTRLFTLQQRHQNALRRKNAGAQIRNRNAHAHGALLHHTRHRHQPAHALRDLVKARSFGQRARLAKAGDAGIDQAGVVDFEAVVINPQSKFDIGSKVFHHNVSAFDQTLEHGNTFRLFQIQRDRAFVAMRVLVVRPLLPTQRIVPAHVIRHLHLHHIGTPIGQLPTSRGPRPYLGQVNHAKPL